MPSYGTREATPCIYTLREACWAMYPYQHPQGGMLGYVPPYIPTQGGILG